MRLALLFLLIPVVAFASIRVESRDPRHPNKLPESGAVEIRAALDKPSPGIPVVRPSPAFAVPQSKQGALSPTSPLASDLRLIPGSGDQYSKGDWTKDAQVCTYTSLTSGVSNPVTLSPELFIANQTFGYWTAVGIRSLPGDDWDLELYQDLGPDPACVDTFLAFSNYAAGVDVVVGDFNFETPGARYARATRFSGTGDAVIEWDSGADILIPNGGATFQTIGPDDVLEIWDVNLQAGLEYRILLNWTGDAALRVLLFENPAASPFSTGRIGAIVDSTFLATVTPGISGWHGLVVVNENGGSADYTIELGTCDPPIPLTSGVSRDLPHGQHLFSFNQIDSYWTALAVRPNNPGPEWTTFAYETGSGGSWPTCFTNPLDVAHGVGYEDRLITFVTLDFNSGGLGTGTYYAWAGPDAPDGSMARYEWDSGADVLGIDQAPVYRATDSTDVIEIWDVYLNEKTPYNVLVSMTGTAAPLVEVIWQDPTYGSSAHTLGVPEPGIGICQMFVPLMSSWHGLAIMNFNGGTGTYGVSLTEAFQEVADPLLQNTEDGRGCSWVDFDGDGDLDLHITNAFTPNRLFVNDGAGNFTDGTAPTLPFVGNWLAAKWADYDNDGDPDLAIPSNNGPMVLFRNESGAGFSDVTPAVFNSSYTGGSFSWIDYDSDGNLDIHLANGSSSRLFQGDGTGLFVDVTPALIAAKRTDYGTWGDFDDDGDLDLYCVAWGANALLRNDGGGAFVDITTPPLDDLGEGYQAAAADFDDDGDLDLCLVNGSGFTLPSYPNRVLRNDGAMSFTDVTPVALSDSTDTRGVMWTDYDNDGNLDILTLGGGVQQRLFANNGYQFYEVAPTAFGTAQLTAGATVADADNDGDVDFYFSQATSGGSGLNQFVRNDLCNPHAWVKIKLQGVVSNRDGIGAKLLVHTMQGSKTARWDMTADGAGFGGAPLTAHIGIGYATNIDSVVVLWPSGIRQALIAPAPYQTLLIVEDTSSLVGVPDGGAIPTRLLLHASVPNPFNPATTIRFELPRSGPVALRVYDARGRLVRTLVDDGQIEAGPYEVVWDGRDGAGAKAASGVYFYRLDTNGESLSRKMVLLD